MAKYLIQANYVGEGVKGLLKDGGSVSRAAVEKPAKPAGGAVEDFYYAFGESDLYIIVDFPDNVPVAAAALPLVAGLILAAAGAPVLVCAVVICLTPVLPVIVVEAVSD
mgnify:CR=1 FL=1